MFYPNDHERACKLIRFTREIDENGQVVLPRRSSTQKRSSLRFIAEAGSSVKRQNTRTEGIQLWNETPEVKEVKPKGNKYQFMYGFIDDHTE